MSSLADLLVDVVAEARRGPSPEQREAERQAAQLARDAEEGRQSLRSFIPMAWPIIQPVYPLVYGWHVDAIADHLEAVSAGEIMRLLITIQPRIGKSTLVSVLWPAWEWTQRPGTKWLTGSYGKDLAMRDTLASRRLIESAWYRTRWPGFQLLRDQNTKSRYDNDHAGYRIATSVDGGATGEGGDIIIVDDPNKIEHAHSESALAASVTWFREVLSGRLNDRKTGRIVGIMQRLNEKDVGQAMIELGYHHLCLPAEYEPAHPFVYPETVELDSGRELQGDPRSEEGELLCPDRYGPDEIAAEKEEKGAMGTAGQLQQRPAPAEGGTFNATRFRRYSIIFDQHDRPVAYTLHRAEEAGGPRRVELRRCRFLQTIDLAASERSSADFFVIGTFAVTPQNDILVLDILRDHVPGPKQPGLIEEHFHAWRRVSKIAMQGPAYELTMIQTLKEKGLPVKPLDSDRDKVSRAIVAGVRYEGGSIYHPVSAPWLAAFEAELVVFPNGAHDDQVDVIAYAAEETTTLRKPIRAQVPQGHIPRPGRRAPLR